MTSKALRLFAISMTLIAFTAISPAQPRHEPTAAAYVPFEFVIGNRVFPAGKYVFEIATGSPTITDEAGVLVIRSRERGLYAAIATGVATDSNVHTKPGLAFRRDGERMYLANVWCRGSETGLAVHLPQGVAEIVEREPLTLDATMTGGI